MVETRAIDWSRAHFTLPTGYAGQYLYSGESCIVVATRVPAKVDGPSWHTHPGDQSYVVLEGSLTVELGDQEVLVRSGSAVFIPAGLPHRNRNDGDVEEVHFEVIAPGVVPSLPSSTPFDGPASASHDVPGLVPFVAEGKCDKASGPEITREWLIDRRRGAVHAGICAVEVPPRETVSSLHVHEFEQLFFVTSGVLTVQIGVETVRLTRHSLVVIPAMVPHRSWNESDVVERHITVVIPEPDSSPDVRPWEIAVDLSRVQ